MMIVASNQECGRTAIHNAARANEALWQLVDPSQPSLSYIPATTSAGGYALLLRSDFESPADIFGTLMPLNLVSDVIDNILARNPSAFTDEAGPHRPRNLHVSARDVNQALACRIWIQGQGIAAGPNMKAGLKSALVFLGQRSNERLNGFRKTYHVHRTFCIDAGQFEKGSNSAFNPLWSVETLCCVFRFTGRGGIVTQSPKQARKGRLPSRRHAAR